ncbi:hypothetical protein B5V88_16030 [Heyndrickxia sporothermodurans]|nr:hypothetical protein B5V88_16030 [Heyndrickxia sporothermodurans]PTY84551.1 hypothetical protein B5V90_15005 [Heyndrickxia sporothermodurans]PTY85022.1 hypothetical protein B5V91_11415 [Heyndrickxia sporothermodurans]
MIYMVRKRMKTRVMVNQICVNSVDTASGIFVGTNYANNWSSHRKNNYGFGSLSHSQVSNNFSQVIDNDLVDTPINSQSYHLMDQQMERNNNQFDIGEININVLESNSALTIGDNSLNGWSSHSKRNAGQGKLIGAINNTNNRNSIADSDMIDSTITNSNIGIPT